MNITKPKEIKHTDFLVIGSGIAGLSFALNASKHGRVTIITKSSANDCNTSYAQGGIACVSGLDDDLELHILDTLEAGAGLCNEEAVRVMVQEASQSVMDLSDWGVDFTMSDETFELGLEGGHSRNRIVHAHDFTGLAIENTLLNEVKKQSNIELIEHHLAIDLITSYDADNLNKSISCIGAEMLDEENLEVSKIISNFTVLCTGGAGQIFLNTTNPEIATGDGIAMAFRAGAEVSDLEFVQFHPTALYNPNGKTFLISEALRGAGAVLRNISGEDFMHKYHYMGGLAPRDIVSRAIRKEMEENNQEYVWLDATLINPKELVRSFPQIYNTCIDLGIDIIEQYIPVAPSAHYMCGGVSTNLDAQTSISNLYAFGEVACTGVHGANRLASNSLLEALVFAKRAFLKIISNFEPATIELNKQYILPSEFENPYLKANQLNINYLKNKIKFICWNNCGIIREPSKLKQANSELEKIERLASKIYNNSTKTRQTIELYNMSIVANLIVKAAINRKESAGSHFLLSNSNITRIKILEFLEVRN